MDQGQALVILLLVLIMLILKTNQHPLMLGSLTVLVKMIILKEEVVMILFWGLGADDLTGNGGSDTYFYSDFLEGADTIRTFSAADTLKFAHKHK